MGNWGKAWKLLYCSVDLIFDCLGLEIPFAALSKELVRWLEKFGQLKVSKASRVCIGRSLSARAASVV